VGVKASGTCGQSIGPEVREPSPLQKCGGSSAENGDVAYTLRSFRQGSAEASSAAVATMSAAKDTLPTRNEEYATREYWCALMHRFRTSLKPS
jgi:hypothetical protein